MPKIHPDELTLQGLVEALGSTGLDKVLEHLAGCERCQEKLRTLLHAKPDRLVRKLARVLPWPAAARDYGAILDRGSHEILRRLPAFDRERAEAAALYEELVALPPERQDLLLANDRRFHSWGLLEVLLERCREESFKDAQHGERLANIALCQAGRLDDAYYGPSRVEDMKARAWGMIANARRMRSDFRGAEEAFAQAEAHLRDGTNDALEKATLLDLKASLKRDLRQLDESARLLGRAIEIFRDAGERHRAGRSLVNLANVHRAAGSPERAIPLLHQAVEMVDPEVDSRLLLCARHNLISYLAEAGQFMEARRLLVEARAFYRRFPESWVQNRRFWAEARIARGLGQLDEAERAFLAAREGFVADGVAYDVALVSLELAALYAQQGRLREVKALAEEMVTIFRSREVFREALAALAFLTQAAEREAVTREVLAHVADYLRRAQHDPGLKFEEPIDPIEAARQPLLD